MTTKMTGERQRIVKGRGRIAGEGVREGKGKKKMQLQNDVETIKEGENFGGRNEKT